jgi:1-acyl-sn-glycerol-3-phosphate acyltransferase
MAVLREILAILYAIIGIVWMRIGPMWAPRINRLNRQGKAKEADQVTITMLKRFARRLIKIIGIEVEIIGQENLPKHGRYVLVGNHQGHADPFFPFLFMDRGLGFVAKKELRKLPIVPYLMELDHCVLIDRKDLRQSLKAIQEGAEFVRNGYPVMIYPEGTRSTSEKMLPFKSGALNLALKANAEIVPVTTVGSFWIHKKGSYLIEKSKVRVVIDAAIPTVDLDRQGKKELSIKIHDQIEKNLEKYKLER